MPRIRSGSSGGGGGTVPSSAFTAGATASYGSVIPLTRVLTLGANLTIGALGTPAGGSAVSGVITLVLKQAATGGPYTVGWPAALEWAGDAPAPAMPVVANSELVVQLLWTGQAWRAIKVGEFYP
jgi:hypothetical protein